MSTQGFSENGHKSCFAEGRKGKAIQSPYFPSVPVRESIHPNVFPVCDHPAYIQSSISGASLLNKLVQGSENIITSRI